MKKLLSLALALLMLAVMLPVVSLADEQLPSAPTRNGDEWTVTTENIQKTLDGAYGSIDGKTIILSAGNYGKLELGRATKYTGSNTDYYIGGVSEANKKTYDEFVTIKNNGQWSGSAYYVRNMSNVTIKAAPGATVTVVGLTGGSGHVYGECYDYVLDKAYTSGSAYYLTQNWSNITIEGITFTAPVDISSSLGTTVIDGVAFKNCAFNINNTAQGNQALRYYNENNDGRVKNLTVDTCSFKNCFQGVYTQKINGITVMNSSFDTTAHNAIAVQSGSDAVNHKAVVITGNTFANIGDRIIRFGVVGADTAITISGNTSTNSGDARGEIIKAQQTLPDTVNVSMVGNNWGTNKEGIEAIFGNGFENVVDEPIPEPSTPIIIYTPDSSPVFLSGANQTVAPGSAATFRIDKEFSELQSVAVDGVTLDKSNYKAWSGSTYVELTAAHMKTLAVGTHTLSVYFTGDTATTTFTISKDATKNPTTGANDFVGVAAAAAVMALLGSAVLLRKK